MAFGDVLFQFPWETRRPWLYPPSPWLLCCTNVGWFPSNNPLQTAAWHYRNPIFNHPHPPGYLSGKEESFITIINLPQRLDAFNYALTSSSHSSLVHQT